MRGREVLDRLLVLFLVNRPGEDERIERLEVQFGTLLTGIDQRDGMPAMGKLPCRGFGNLASLALRRGVRDQNVHDVPPLVKWPAAPA